MKKLEFKTGKGEFILEEASDKHLGRVLVKYMTEEQFSEVVDSITWRYTSGGSNTVYKNYLCNNELSESGVIESAKQSFESLVDSLGYYLFTNPIRQSERKGALLDDERFERLCKYEDEITFFNPILLKKI